MNLCKILFTMRLHTAVSNNCFDLKGREKENKFEIAKKGKGYEVKVALDNWNEIAVIE